MKYLLALLMISFAVSQHDSVSLQLANVERAFSALSEKEGIKHSFLTFLDDSCIMFNPYPVNGKLLYQNGQASTRFLSWYPTFVEVAASSDFGISTGPWEIRASKGDTVSANGYFFSVWEKRNGKEWKVTLDLGISFPKDHMRVEAEGFYALQRFSAKNLSPTSAHSELMEVEKNFIQTYKQQAAIKAYTFASSNNLRIYRDGYFPATNRKESLERLAADVQQKDFIPLGIHIAASADMGFTYGYAINAKNDSSSYVRVWRKEKEWKIAVDIQKKF